METVAWGLTGVHSLWDPRVHGLGWMGLIAWGSGSVTLAGIVWPLLRYCYSENHCKGPRTCDSRRQLYHSLHMKQLDCGLGDFTPWIMRGSKSQGMGMQESWCLWLKQHDLYWVCEPSIAHKGVQKPAAGRGSPGFCWESRVPLAGEVRAQTHLREGPRSCLPGGGFLGPMYRSWQPVPVWFYLSHLWVML